MNETAPSAAFPNLTMRETNEMLLLMRELADDVAATDVQSFGRNHRGHGETPIEQCRNSWYSRPEGDTEAERDAEYFDRAVRYLRLRGLLERHPMNPSLVRPTKEAIR